MKLGLVILNYNDAERTISLAEKAASYPHVDAVCVVDNASTDDSPERLRKLFRNDPEGNRGNRKSCVNSNSFRGQVPRQSSANRKIFLLEAEKNGGYAAGNNLGCRFLMEQCGCDILLIANPDVAFTDNAVRLLRDAFGQHPEYGAIGPVMKNPDETVSSRPYLQIPTFWQGVGLCFYSYNRIYERKHPYGMIENSAGSGIMDVDALQGSLWAVRADIFRRCGGLDEGTFLFYEEMSFAMRMREKCPEYREGLLLTADYIHNHSASIRSSLSQMRTFRIYMQSKLYFERTYHHARGFCYRILKLATLIATGEERLFLLVRR